ncbi:MAG: flagellar biosynthesis protein FlhB [Candidatus Melainabacteria bacterium]|jgi:flagellar biosynthetic protein FlhB
MGSGDDQASEKKFDPTPRRLQKLREQGNVPKSRDLAQLATFIAGVSFLITGGNYIWERLLSMFRNLWGAIALRNLGEMGTGFIIEHSIKNVALVIVPLLLFTALSAIVLDGLQVGFNFSTESIGFKPERLNPFQNLKQIFTIAKVVELLKELIKVATLAFVAWRTIGKHFTDLFGLLNASSIAGVAEIMKAILMDFTTSAVLALLVIALADLFFQRFDFTRKNRMTMKDMVDEMKESEGDPYMKAKRRQMARQMTQRRQIANLPEADFITTNPSKIAVAIKYTSGEMSAPKVIAKGGDAFAWRIIQVGKEHGIPIIENIPLARALYKLVKVEQEVPPELYRAVAEILLFVYQVRGKAKFR